MEELSDKARLKEIMGRNGLEVIPGTQVLASAQGGAGGSGGDRLSCDAQGQCRAAAAGASGW